MDDQEFLVLDLPRDAADEDAAVRADHVCGLVQAVDLLRGGIAGDCETGD